MIRVLAIMLPFAAVVMGLSGCGVASSTVGFDPAYPPPSATGLFDGSYYGRAKLVRSEPGALCPRSRIGVAEIGDKRLSFAYLPDVVFNPPVAKNGTLHDQVGPSVLDGRVQNGDLVFQVMTPTCTTRYDLFVLHNRS